MPRMGRDIDERLADLDRRLRAVQEELLPDREPRPVASPASTPTPTPTPTPEPEPQPEPEPEPPLRPPEPEPPPPPRQGPPPPPPRRHPPLPPPPPRAAPITELHAKLLASFRELLDAYEWLLTQMAQPPGPPSSPDPASHPAGVTAGPFPSTDAVRAFEAELAALPGVRAVSVRGYEGADRAIFDVEVGQP